MAADTLAAAEVIQIPAPVQPEPPLPEELPGPEGTLLAIVSIPGTASSMAIWGYRVPRDATPAGPSAASRPQARGLIVDHARRCVWLNGEEVVLTYQEFELLAFLSANPAQVFSRADLLHRVWGQSPNSTTRTVDVHVSRAAARARAVLRSLPGGPSTGLATGLSPRTACRNSPCFSR